MPLPVLKTPAEFIDYYFSQMKTSFGNDNIKLSKTGFMGFILNILGNTQFDNKQYVDGLFLEAFPALAQDDKNLQFHSSLHGYNISMATAATVTSGKFNLDLSLLPTPQLNLTSRVISFGVSGTPSIAVDAGGIIYSSDAAYKITSKISAGAIVSYYAETAYPGGQVNSAVQISAPSIPMVNMFQADLLVYSEAVPFYPIGSHYTISLTIPPNTMVSDISAELISVDGVFSLIADTDKNIYGPNDNVIFYTMLPGGVISIELGSGIKGKYVPEGSTIVVSIKSTSGVAGNISPPGLTNIKSYTGVNYAASAVVTDTYPNSNPSVLVVDLGSFLSPIIENASGGVDILSGAALRDSLMRYIQTRDSIVSQTDYNNVLAQLFQHYAISVNKSKLANNTISLYIPMIDRYGVVYPTATTNINRLSFESNMFVDLAHNVRTVFEPELTISGIAMMSPFHYTYDYLYNMYSGRIIKQDDVYNYSSVTTTDSVGLKSTIAESPHIFMTMVYHHSTASAYSILKISSYEDISMYAIAGGTSVKFIGQNTTYTSATPHNIPTIGPDISFIFGQIASPLRAILTNVATVVSVIDASPFPSSGTIIIGAEQMSYSSISGNDLLGVIRGINTTLAATHAVGDAVKELTTSQSLNQDESLGLLNVDSQIMVILDNVDLIAKTGFKHVYNFSVQQTLNIPEYLQVKQYNIIGVSNSLNATLAVSATVATVVSTNGFTSSGSLVIDNEEVTYSAITAATFTGIVRALNATYDVRHISGSIVRQITSTDLEVPMIDKSRYITERPAILANIISNYGSLSIPSNRMVTDEVQLKFINTVNISRLFLQQTVTNGSLYVSSGAILPQINAPLGLIFPLKVSISLLLNREIITANGSDVLTDIDNMKMQVAQDLTNKYTGTKIRISDADIILIAKQLPYVDDANVNFTDSAATPINIANNEINVIPENTIVSNLSKLDRLEYTPTLWHWDINNILADYSIE